MKDKIKNLLRLFLNGIRDYESENGDRVCLDERDSSEFVDIFLDSEDSFDYHDLIKTQKERPDKNDEKYYDSVDHTNKQYFFRDQFDDDTQKYIDHLLSKMEDFDKEFVKDLARMYADTTEFKSDFPHDWKSVFEGYVEGMKTAIRLVRLRKE